MPERLILFLFHMALSCALVALKSTKFPYNCYHFLILVLSLVLLSGCQSINSDDAQDNVIGWQQSAPLVQQKTVLPDDWNYGAILNEESGEKMPGSYGIEEIVLIKTTGFNDGKTLAFSYSGEGILNPFLEIAKDGHKKMVNTGMVGDLGQISEGSAWNNDFVKKLGKEHPESKFLLLAVNPDLSDTDAQAIAFTLKNILPDSSCVIALGKFDAAESVNSLVTSYENSFVKDALSMPGSKRLTSLDPKNRGLVILGKYLNYKQAKRAELLGGNQVLYRKSISYDIARDGTVYLTAFGDIMLGRHVRTLMDANTIDYAFSKMEEAYLRLNDILVGNLEGPIAKKGIKTSKTIAFRFMPDVAPLLKKYNRDILGLANNHALDMGANGYSDSIAALNEEGIIPFGDPREITENSVAKTIVNGQKVAFLGLEEVVYHIDEEKASAAIKELADEGYKVIVSPHWGIEYVHKPNKRQIELAHKFIDSGAFAVIAHHPHVVQAYETYMNRPIFYSLGNAVFDQYWSIDTQKGLSLAISFNSESITINMVPLKIDRSRPVIMNDDERKKFMEAFVTYWDYSEEEKNDIMDGNWTLKLN